MCFPEFIGNFNSRKYATDQLVKTTFNNVLLQGDKMYLRALNKGLIVLEPSIEFLCVDNLPKVVGVSSCMNMFSYEIDLMSQTSIAQSNINLPIVVESNIDLPIVVEPIEAQKKSNLPIVVEPIEAQNKNILPIVVEPIEAQNIHLSIVVEPIEAQNIHLPIVVEPIEAQNTCLPIVVEPIEADHYLASTIVVDILKLSVPVLIVPM